MKILGLPLVSFLVLIVIPWILIVFQFYYCWRIFKRHRESRRRRS